MQLGTSVKVSTNDPRVINAVFRNGHVWCVHSGGLPVSAPTHAAVFWYELDPTTMPNPIVQSGVLDGGGNVAMFFPSIGVNSSNDVFVGFSRSDPTKYVEAAYTSRRSADPLGTMNAVSVLRKGDSSYVKTFGGTEVRWGDYSATVVDPQDSVSFWTIQEYAAASVGSNPNDGRWGTWWGTTLVQYVCGDPDSSGTIDIADAVYLISYIFAGGPAPCAACQ
jgi:hypothetical protein